MCVSKAVLRRQRRGWGSGVCGFGLGLPSLMLLSKSLNLVPFCFCKINMLPSSSALEHCGKGKK